MGIAFLFSGQGAQYRGMMRELCSAEKAAEAVFACADKCLGRSISELCFNASQDELNLTVNTQPCLLAADLAAASVLTAHGVTPSAVAGFSLGEYAALTFSKAISMEKAFELVQLRANAMQRAVPAGSGAMAALIGATYMDVEELCASITTGVVSVANYNTPVQTVISGERKAIEQAVSVASERGLRAVLLAVSVPSHCALMEPAKEEMASALSELSFSEPSCPVYMNVDGHTVSAAHIKGNLLEQLVRPVRWCQTVQNMWADGIDTFIECGPGKALMGMAKKTVPEAKILRVDSLVTLESTLSKL